MDFLTFLTRDSCSKPDVSVLVLNSTNLYRQMFPYIEGPRFKAIYAYLDNDEAGDAVTEEIITHAKHADVIDARTAYKGYKDLNAWHMSLPQ